MSNSELSNQIYYVILNEYGAIVSHNRYFTSIEEAKKYFERNIFEPKNVEWMDKIPLYQGYKNSTALRNEFKRKWDIQMQEYRLKFTIHLITFNFVENA
jgi:hypothetical protein